ncbi:MAG: sortase, partial [Oscillospiraceae bacterium]|nr:sortase [Oscillospiraceae bacterium]
MSDNRNTGNDPRSRPEPLDGLDSLLDRALNVDLTGGAASPGDAAGPGNPQPPPPNSADAAGGPPPERGPKPSPPPRGRLAAARLYFLSLSPARRFFLCLCVVAALGSAGYLAYYGIGSITHRIHQADVGKMIPTPPPPAVTGTPATPPPLDAEGWDYPPSDPEIDYRTLYADVLARNSDFIGILNIPGLTIKDMVFVQTTDNDLYLTRNFDRKRSDRGTVFMDYQAAPDFSGSNTVLYGHNMKDGTMFRPLLKYQTVKGYESAPVVYLDTIYGPTVWLVFAAYICEPDYGYADTLVSGTRYDALLEEIYMRSVFHTNIEVDERDSILTLSTCDYDFEDARFAVHARRLRPGETLEGLTFEARPNTSRKEYNVPYERLIGDVPVQNIALSSFSELRRYYYHQRGGSGILWYTGSARDRVQGPFTAYTGEIDETRYSWLATGNNMPERVGRREFYIVSGGLDGRTPGLYLLQSNIPRGPFSLTSQTPLTPAGIDARWPCLVNDGSGEMTLYYTVREAGSPAATVIFSMPLKGGSPRELARYDASLDIRPVGAVPHGGKTAVIVQSFASGMVFGFYPGSEEPEQFELPRVGQQSGRYAIHLSAVTGGYTALSQSGGRMEFEPFDTAWIPAPKDAPPPPPATPAPPPGPSPPPAT